MNARRERRLFEVIGPMFEAGEMVRVTAIVNLRSMSVRRTVAYAAVSTVLSAGWLTVTPARVPYYLAMTDRRIFIVGAQGINDVPGEVQMMVPLAGLVRTQIKERVLNSSFVVSFPGGGDGLKLIFPLPHRKARDVVASVLPVGG